VKRDGQTPLRVGTHAARFPAMGNRPVIIR
jgi:hypothetical protein